MNNPVGFFLNLDQGSLSNEQVVAMLAEVGYDCIEYGMTHLNPQTMSGQQMRDLVGLTEAGGLKVSEWVVQRELVHRDDSVREKELQLTLDCIAAAADLGIGVLNIYTGPAPFMEIGSPVLHQQISEGEAWDMVCNAMDRLVPAAEKAQVKLAVEAVYGMVSREYYAALRLGLPGLQLRPFAYGIALQHGELDDPSAQGPYFSLPCERHGWCSWQGDGRYVQLFVAG